MISIYNKLYDLIVTYIFGAVVVGTHQELVTICLSTIGCLFVFALPFVLVLKVIKILLG